MDLAEQGPSAAILTEMASEPVEIILLVIFFVHKKR